MIILTHEIFDKIKDPFTFYVLTASIAKRASFDRSQSCFPSIQTICEDTGFSKDRVLKSLKDLEFLGFLKITKIKSQKNQYQSNQYQITTDLIKIVGDLKSGSEVVRETGEGSPSNRQPSPSNRLRVVRETDSNLKSNLTSSTDNIKEKKFCAENYIENLKENPDLIQAMLDWLEIRKAKKTPTTQKAVDLGLGTLEKLAKGNLEEKIKIVNQSVERGWTGFFELPKPRQNFSNNQRKPDFFPSFHSEKIANFKETVL